MIGNLSKETGTIKILNENSTTENTISEIRYLTHNLIK